MKFSVGKEKNDVGIVITAATVVTTEIRLKDLTFSGIYAIECILCVCLCVCAGGALAKGKSLANETSRSKETLNLHLNISHAAYKREYQRWK